MTSLKTLDDFLAKFALDHNMSLEKDNAKGSFITGFEDRSLRWSKDNLNFLIQICPDVTDDQIRNWIIWICATYDEEGARHWWRKTLVKSNKNKILSVARNEIVTGFKKLDKLDRGDLRSV